jgi:anti-anti-sigma factor
MTLIESSSVIGPPQDLAAATGPNANRHVVWLRGEYDISTEMTLSHTMARVMALDEGDLVVDLSEVTFMDAATIGLIIRARNDLRLQCRSLTLRSPSGFARRVLDLCGLTDELLRSERRYERARIFQQAALWRFARRRRCHRHRMGASGPGRGRIWGSNH